MNLPANIDDTSIISKLTSIAREIAVDINPIETILKGHQLTDKEWVKLQRSPAFKKILEEQLQIWNSVLSIEQRLRLKQAAMLEESLETLFGDLVDRKQPLAPRVELFKALQRGGTPQQAGADSAGKVSITINLGADSKLQFEKPLPAPVTIEGEVVS